MDIEEFTDPSLDQDKDIEALLKRRQTRKIVAKTLATFKELINVHCVLSKTIRETLYSKDTNPEVNNREIEIKVGKIKTPFFEAAERDDVTKCQKLAEHVTRLNLTLSDEMLRRNSDDSTVLHFSLENGSWNVAEYLIKNGNEELLTDVYSIVVDNASSRKNCLHILTEKGKDELLQLLLERLPKEEAKIELMKTVLTKLEGEDPREFNCMHLAALKGHKNLIELFHQEFEVDVNITNNKKDTPVLLAVRGNHAETVRKLMELGANLEQEDEEGLTPLYCAVRYGNVDLVKIILYESRDKSWIIANHKRQTGFVSPIVLASALGYHKIVQTLLENGADANVKINNDQTALHVAAAEGNDEVIKVLLVKGKVAIDHADKNGNTAILFAAKAGNIKTVKILIENGANKYDKNEMGQNIWDHAMNKRDKKFLKAVVELYKNDQQTANSSELNFLEGKILLHVAASKGDLETIKFLLEIGADREDRDSRGNTFFHVAAIDNRREVIEAFLSEVDINDANYDGDTALHLACKSGHIETTQVLLQKAKLDARNKLGRTPLHIAVDSDAVSPGLIKILVDTIVKANNQPLLDAQDHEGNTALHIAAKHARTEIFHELSFLNPTIENKDGDYPFHVAAESGTLFEMLDVFRKSEKEVNIDQSKSNRESCLHVCARKGDFYALTKLVHSGADLALQNSSGNTVIHAIIEESVKEKANKKDLREVFKAITRVSTRWWCMKEKKEYPKEELYPKEDTHEYNRLLRKAMLHLTSKVKNNKNENAVEYAIEIGAVELLEEILNTPNVYRFRDTWSDSYEFDITNFFPETTEENIRKIFAEGESNDDKNEKKKPKTDIPYIDRILSLEKVDSAWKILDINPFKHMVRNSYQILYVALMLIHIVYMSLFSVYVLPVSDDLYTRYNSTTESGCPSGGKNWVYGLFLIWPALILLYEIYSIYTIAENLREKIKKVADADYFPLLEEDEDMEGSDFLWKCFSVLYWNTYRFDDCISNCFLILNEIFKYLTNIESLISFAFCGIAIAWYVLFLCPSDMSSYVEIASMVLVIGWLYTIIFTKGFEGMHTYSIMLKRIIWQDITRYLFMYVFFLLGCGLAFSALFQIVPSSGCTENSYFHASVWITLFDVFGLMLGLGSLFDESFDECYTKYGGNPAFVRCLYVFYIICATIILINLLISMMSDTYRNIKAEEVSTWKRESLVLWRQIDRLLPLIKLLLRNTHIDRVKMDFNYDFERCMFEIPLHKIEALKERERDELLITVERLENKINNLQKSELTMLSSGDDSSSSPPTKRSSSFVTDANQIRIQPGTINEITQIEE